MFLGTGYYYWDYNLNYAKTYGTRRYGKQYFIVETSLNLPAGLFLDLVGNRMHMEILIKLRKRLIEKGLYTTGEWYLGTFIEFLKKLSEKESNTAIFPYKAIRCMDYGASRENKYSVRFVEPKTAPYTYLDPRMVICLTEKLAIILQGNRIVYDGRKF